MFFFFPDPPPTAIYTLSLHDALPICMTPASPDIWSPSFRKVRLTDCRPHATRQRMALPCAILAATQLTVDRKSTRLNSSHPSISYAVFCLKKKKKYDNKYPQRRQPRA